MNIFKKFVGLNIEFADINFGIWDGFGFSILTITLQWKGDMWTCGEARALFFLKLGYDLDNGGKKVFIRMGIFFRRFEIWSKTLKPPVPFCHNCDGPCENAVYYDHKPYCSEECADATIGLN